MGLISRLSLGVLAILVLAVIATSAPEVGAVPQDQADVIDRRRRDVTWPATTSSRSVHRC